MTEASLALAPQNINAASERIPELDGLRGLAVLLVMAYHAFAYEMTLEPWHGLGRVLATLTNLGWLGVDLFFVLSGFLITSVLLRTHLNAEGLRSFYWRRALRILPLYFVVLLVIWLSYSGAGSFVLLSAFFLSNFVTLFGVPLIYGPLWSLAVEEHFYLVWPWVMRFVTLPRLAWLAAGIALTQPLARGVGFYYSCDIYYFTWFRLDGLAWGAFFACLFYCSTQPGSTCLRFVKAAWSAALALLLVGYLGGY